MFDFLPMDNSARLVEQLKGTKVNSFKAKDIFRASALSLLGVSNSHVEKDLEKIETAASSLLFSS